MNLDSPFVFVGAVIAVNVFLMVPLLFIRVTSRLAALWILTSLAVFVVWFLLAVVISILR